VFRRHCVDLYEQEAYIVEIESVSGATPVSDAEVARTRQTRRSLALIFSIMLLDIVGLSVLSPVAPYIVQRYSSEALMVTMVTVLYAAAQFFAAPLMGKLGDRYGRRPVLLVSLLGQAAGYLLFGIGGSLWVLFLGRLIGGITGGNLSTATAYIADVSKPHERAKNFTLIGMAWGAGLILGPALGSLFGQISLEAPACAAAIFSLVNVLVGIFILPESLPKAERETTPMRLRDYNPLVSIADMARKPGLGWLLLVQCLFNFVFSGINSTGTLFVIQKFAAESWQIGLMLVLGGVALAVVQFLLVQRLVPRFGSRRVAIASLVGQGVWSLLFFFTPALWLIYPVNMLLSATAGFTFPTLTTLVTERVAHREVGLLMGVTTAIGSLMNIAGPLWGGAVYDAVMPGAPHWMGFVIYIFTALMLFRPGPPATAAQTHTPVPPSACPGSR
jgi:MFS transporter, DHA1 family, tetracycline resistance protein